MQTIVLKIASFYSVVFKLHSDTFFFKIKANLVNNLSIYKLSTQFSPNNDEMTPPKAILIGKAILFSFEWCAKLRDNVNREMPSK